MDRKLKERIVGAVLLVLAAVLVIPLFLDGPDPETRVERPAVTLPPADDTDARTRTVRLEQQRDTPTAPPTPAAEAPLPTPAPAPVAPSPQAPTDSAAAADAAPPVEPAAPPPRTATAPPEPEPPTPVPVPQAPAAAATEPTPASPAAPTAPAGENWVIQLGSFGNRDNADRLAAELREKRYQSFVTRHESEGRVLHRVRVGPASTREEADALLARLVSDGYRGQAVPE